MKPSKRLVASGGVLLWALAVACGDEERGPRSSCLSGRTRVRTPRGLQSLDTLRVGDEILACDPATRAVTARKIVALVAEPMAETFALDAGDVHLEGATSTHPFWVESRQAWVVVADLVVGDVLTVFNERDGTVASRALESMRPTGRREPVFDLTVEGPEHTFFADGILVHNKSVAPPCYPDCGYPAADGGEDASDEDASEASDAGGDAS